MKRFFDLIISFTFAIMLSPLWLFISILIKLDTKGPIFFRQVRIGKNKKEFRIFKFRTMFLDAHTKGAQITIGAKDSRITPTGYFLRKTKLDELPQLFNIIKGEMSFVGPRPEVPKYVKMYNSSQLKVLDVRPGITDIASLEYFDENELLKDALDPEKTYTDQIMPDKLKLNLEYLARRSFLSDISIILKTLSKVIR